MKFKILIILFFGLFLNACSHYGESQFKNTDFKTAKITSSIISDNEGFGFEIWVDGKKYIYLRYIPTMKPYKRFTNAEDAQKVADLTIEKLRNEIIPPKISKEEIENLKLSY
jgi:hypothetical protein